MHMRLSGERARDVVGGDDAVAHERIDNAGRAIEPGAGLFDLLARDETDVLEDAKEVIFVRLHGKDILRQVA